MTLKTTILSLLIVVICSCAKEQSITEQASDVVVVKSFLDINKPICNIRVGNLLSIDDLPLSAHTNVRVSIMSDDEIYDLTEYESGVYSYADETVLVEANTQYDLVVETENAVLTSSTITPRDKGMVSLTGTELSTDFIDQIDIAVGEPNDGSKVFYVVKITPLEDDLIPIDFSTVSNRSSWIEDNDGFIPLRSNYFKYYGTHRIDVQRINYEYIDLFKGKEEDGFLTNPGNIQNGLGFFVGKDGFSVEIELLD